MAHEIYQAANGMHSFARAAGTDAAWHDLGQQWLATDTREEKLAKAGLAYLVQRAMVQFQNGTMHTFPGREVLYRSDTNAPLGVVSDGYHIVQPSECYDFNAELCDRLGFTMETGGALRGGALYWTLAKTGHETTGPEAHKGYVLLSTTADGTRATDARFTRVRVVCANTMAMAMRDNVGAVRTSHRTKFNAKTTKERLGLVDDINAQWEQAEEDMRQLQQIEVTAQEASVFFADLLRPAGTRAAPRKEIGAQSFAELLAGNVGAPIEFAATDKETRAIRGLADLEESYVSAPGAVPGTAWGLVQGVTHYVDHVRGTDADKRMLSAWFGQGDTLKSTAYEKAMAIGR